MSVLTDILPPQVRKIVYAVLTLAGLALSAWLAADGDWLKFAGALISTLAAATAASNTPPSTPPPAGE